MSRMIEKEILCHKLDNIFGEFIIERLKKFDWDDYEGMVVYAHYYRKFLTKVKRNIWQDSANIASYKTGDNLRPTNLILRNVKSLIHLFAYKANNR